MKEWEERWRKGGKQVHIDSSHRMRFVSPACSLFMLPAPVVGNSLFFPTTYVPLTYQLE